MTQKSALTRQQVYNSAIRMLARRDHSTTELRQKLRNKFGRIIDEVSSDQSGDQSGDKSGDKSRDESGNKAIEGSGSILDDVLARIGEYGYLDDQRYAESYARSRVSRGYGPQYIQRDLAQKGIDSEGIEVALTPFAQQWPQIAQDLVERRYADASRNHSIWEKAARFLQRRGFSSGTVMHALGERPRPDPTP